MLKGIRLVAALGALMVSATAATAFEETRGGGASAPAAKVAPSAPAEPGVKLNLEGTGLSVAPSTGTEVRIPGLGKLGILPKLDFGLELLYGVNEKSLDERRLLPDQTEDGVGIRGTLKHRF
jgi:hypothetical protein